MHTEDTEFDKIPQDIMGEKKSFQTSKLVSSIILFGSWPSVTFHVQGYNPCCSQGGSKAPEAYADMCNVGL